jgi:hypothetical protein
LFNEVEDRVCSVVLEVMVGVARETPVACGLGLTH